MARTSPVNSGFTIINGSGTGSNGKRIDVWIEYKLGAQSVTGNYTPISVYFYAALNPSYTSGTTKRTGLDSALKVNGVAGTGVTNGAYDFTSSGKVNALGSYSGNIKHNEDGSGSITVSGSFTTESTYISGGSVSGSIVLPTIARASTIGATNANIGETSVIAVSVKGNYQHSIAYAFGDLSGYIDADGNCVDTEVKFNTASIPFAVPECFYEQIPDDPAGICTLTCRTYSGDTQIGGGQTGTFTVTAKESECKPEVSGTVEDVNQVTLALTGDASKLIRHHSTARCVISAQAKNCASIAQKSIGGVQVTENSLDIENITLDAIIFRAEDSRGYAEEAQPESCSFIAYTPLTNLASVSRDDPTSGNATVKLGGIYYDGSFGAEANSLRVDYRVGSGDWVTVRPELTFAEGKYSGRFALTGLDYMTAHTVDVRVTDALEAVTKTLSVQKGIPVFDWGENDFVFHVPVTAPALGGATIDAILKRLEALEQG